MCENEEGATGATVRAFTNRINKTWLTISMHMAPRSIANNDYQPLYFHLPTGDTVKPLLSS